MAAIPTPPPPTEELLTSPFMKKMNTPTLQEDVNVAVIGAVIAVVFVTLLSVIVLIIIYLYKNKGSYRTYEQPEGDPEGAVQMEDFPCKSEKEEYFI
ncbi:small cell adhesion glycoprotein [Tiliqua scincoides]|uniref:small cell adhesion glycoprotein n=1 Tax=Tiliqua scincoides TaxID=71010 RepID=UPI003463801A